MILTLVWAAVGILNMFTKCFMLWDCERSATKVQRFDTAHPVSNTPVDFMHCGRDTHTKAFIKVAAQVWSSVPLPILYIRTMHCLFVQNIKWESLDWSLFSSYLSFMGWWEEITVYILMHYAWNCGCSLCYGIPLGLCHELSVVLHLHCVHSCCIVSKYKVWLWHHFF